MDKQIRPIMVEEDTLGGRINHARDLTGMSIEAIASRIGVTAETLAEWESDRSEPRANKLMTLAGVLGVAPAWLISGAGEAPESGALQTGLTEMAKDLDRLKTLSAEIADSIAQLEARIEAVRRVVG